jgi:hypothetical protein
MGIWSAMRRNQTHIDRRIVAASARLPAACDAGLVVMFYDPWGSVIQQYNLGTLCFPGDIAVLLAAAFRGALSRQGS